MLSPAIVFCRVPCELRKKWDEKNTYALGEDSALGNDENVLARELLLELADEAALHNAKEKCEHNNA